MDSLLFYIKCKTVPHPSSPNLIPCLTTSPESLLSLTSSLFFCQKGRSGPCYKMPPVLPTRSSPKLLPRHTSGFDFLFCLASSQVHLQMRYSMVPSIKCSHCGIQDASWCFSIQLLVLAFLFSLYFRCRSQARDSGPAYATQLM